MEQRAARIGRILNGALEHDSETARPTEENAKCKRKAMTIRSGEGGSLLSQARSGHPPPSGTTDLESNKGVFMKKTALNDDDCSDLEQIVTKASEKSLVKALNHKVEAMDYLSLAIPKTFGNKWTRFFYNTRQKLSNQYGDRLEDLFFLASRSYVYSCHMALNFMLEIEANCRGIKSSGEEARMSAESYADSEGWAHTLHNELGRIYKPSELLEGTPFDDFPPDVDVLEAMSIVWFFGAASVSSHRKESLDMLFEAIHAHSLAHGVSRWYESENETLATTNLAARMAKVRHAEHYAMYEQALKYWRENIDPNLSASKAANELVRVVPLSHKKLSELVSVEKKKRK